MPYVSSSFPLPDLRSRSSAESREDSDVDDGDCLGVSTGETETELDDDDVTDSVVRLRCKAALRVVTDGDMIDGTQDMLWREGRT